MTRYINRNKNSPQVVFKVACELELGEHAMLYRKGFVYKLGFFACLTIATNCVEAYTIKDFNDGGTHIVNYSVTEDVVNIRSDTEVVLTQGGVIDSEVYVYGTSKFHLSGGQISGLFHGIRSVRLLH